MNKYWLALKQHFWPVSAIIFCPCHLPLTMSAVAGLTAGTVVGTYISTHYSAIESVLAVAFSFYFVLAFMIWVVRGPQRPAGAACAIDEQGRKRPVGLSTRQIVTWGVIGMLSMPALVSVSLFTKQTSIDEIVAGVLAINPANSGFIWLISLSTVVMIPVMVIWLVWMWISWSKADLVRDVTRAEPWQYEYD